MVYDETGKVMENTMALLAEIYENIQPGDHKISVLSGVNVVSCYLRRHEHGTVTFLSSTLPSVLLDIVDQNVAMEGYSAFTLRSVFANTVEEVRGWIITPEGIVTLSPDNLIDAYCYDTTLEKFTSPKPNVRYSDSW